MTQESAGRNGSASRPSTYEHILDSAAAVFTRAGYAGTTMTDIALASGTTRPTVYAYFSSKEEVFRHLTERVRDQFLAIQHVPADLPAAEIVEQTDIQYLRAYTLNEGLLTAIRQQALADPAMGQLWREVHERGNRRHVRFIRRIAAAGEAEPAGSPEAIAEAVTGMVMRFSELIVQDPRRMESLSRELVDLHLRLLGLAQPQQLPTGSGRGRRRDEPGGRPGKLRPS